MIPADDIPEGDPEEGIEEAFFDPSPEDLETAAPTSSPGNYMAAMLTMIIRNRRGAEDVLNRALLLAYVSKLPDAPRTVRELGAEMGVSHAEAHRRVTSLKAILAENSPEYARIHEFRAR